MKKLRSCGGFTLVEMLCAVLILVLAAGAMALEVTFASRTYEDSVETSQAQMLCSTLTTTVTEELRYATLCNADGSFTSIHFGNGVRFGQNEDGQVTLGGEKLLSSKAYPGGMTAKVASISYAGGQFSVTVTVNDSSGKNQLATNSFGVQPLNEK